MSYVTRFPQPLNRVRLVKGGIAKEITMSLPPIDGHVLKVRQEISIKAIKDADFDLVDYVKDKLDEELWKLYNQKMKEM